MSITRVFRNRAALLGEPSQNEATLMVENPFLRADATGDLGFDAKALFVRRYPIIKKALQCHRKQGALILAFDDRTVALGQAWLAGSLDRSRAAIIGRHSMCNLVVAPEHEGVSLRHLAVLVRAVSHSDVRIRVLDLHTQTGFIDESGRVLQAVACEGSLFLRIGRVTLAILATDEAALVSDDAEAQYASIPERVFIEERPGTAGEPEPRRVIVSRPASRSTAVRSQLGPLAAVGNLCREDEPPFGSVVIRTSGGSVRRTVGAAILERGMLVGRYARCDVGVTGDQDSRLSRVHLLIVKDVDEVVGVDTASVNGTFVSERAILLQPLTDGVVLDLGGEIMLSWHTDT